MSNPETWGYVLVAPARPTREEQLAALRALGVPDVPHPPIFEDRIVVGKRGKNAGPSQLAGRNDVITAAMSGDTVIVADPYCLGLSAADAEWFLGRLRDKGVTVVVNGSLFRIAPGDDTAALVEEVGKRQNRAQAAASKARAKAQHKRV